MNATLIKNEFCHALRSRLSVFIPATAPPPPTSPSPSPHIIYLLFILRNKGSFQMLLEFFFFCATLLTLNLQNH